VRPVVQDYLDWLDLLKEGCAKLQLLGTQLPSPRPGEDIATFLSRSEKETAEDAEEAVIEWIDKRVFPDGIRGPVAYWAYARLASGFWLGKAMAAPVDNPTSDQGSFLPIYDGDTEISLDWKIWLISEAWKFSGCEAWIEITLFNYGNALAAYGAE
jgi:hypothetical protein